MGKLILGSVLAGVVLMMWGFVIWGLLSSSLGVVRPITDGGAVAASLKAAVVDDGAYFLPWPDPDAPAEATSEWQQRHREGPVAFVFVRPDGVEPNMGKVMGLGFLHFVGGAFLVGLLLRMASGGASTYGHRVGIVTMAGVFGSFALGLSPSIWWYAPISYTLYLTVTTIVGWFLAGLVLAAFVKPGRA